MSELPVQEHQRTKCPWEGVYCSRSIVLSGGEGKGNYCDTSGTVFGGTWGFSAYYVTCMGLYFEVLIYPFQLW